jgi:hypothetical protein
MHNFFLLMVLIFGIAVSAAPKRALPRHLSDLETLECLLVEEIIDVLRVNAATPFCSSYLSISPVTSHITVPTSVTAFTTITQTVDSTATATASATITNVVTETATSTSTTTVTDTITDVETDYFTATDYTSTRQVFVSYTSHCWFDKNAIG